MNLIQELRTLSFIKAEVQKYYYEMNLVPTLPIIKKKMTFSRLTWLNQENARIF